MTDACRFDVVIIGAGVGGCAAAIALKNQLPALEVLVIDRLPDPVLCPVDSVIKIGESLPPQTVVPLQNLGLWNAFLACGFLPAHGTCGVWGSAKPHVNEFMLSPYGHGWHLDRRRFDCWLVDAARQAGVHFRFGTRLGAECRRVDDGWQLAADHAGVQEGRDQALACRVVIDATGRKARFASALGVQKRIEDNLVAIYASSPLPANGKAGSTSLVESHALGWWYSAALPEARLVIALMTDADIAREHDLGKTPNWQRLLRASTHTRDRAGDPADFSAPVVTAAHSQCLESPAGDGWLAVGDAASCYDPLSSLGIFKALRSAQLAAYAIADCFQGKDGGFEKYDAVIRAEYRQYLDKRRRHYAREWRFPASVFWRRRLRAPQSRPGGLPDTAMPFPAAG